MSANSKKIGGFERLIGCAFSVSNHLGTGFLERVYENALAVEFRKSRLTAEQQKSILIRYDEIIVGDYVADFVVEQNIIVEIKAIKTLDQIHIAQCLNYLRATNLPLALLINFGTPKLQISESQAYLNSHLELIICFHLCLSVV